MNPVKIQGIEMPRYEVYDITALQALAKGVANSDQQKRVLKWIIEDVCQTYQWQYKETERETNISLGRQLVGQILAGQTKLDVSKLRSKE